MTSSPPPLLLGDLTLDLSRGLLLDAAGVPVSLRPQAWKLLQTLARSPGTLHSKQDLLDAVWPGLVVTEDSLVQAIGDIRQALGQAGREILRTLPRRGYMLVPENAPPPERDPSPGSQSLGERLRLQAAQRFVGRETELMALQPAVARTMPAQPLFFVHGPGGIGKSSLLEQLRLKAEPAVEVIVINGAEILPTPTGLIEGVGSALGLKHWEPSLDSLAARWSVRGRSALLLDTFEALEPVQGWMRDSFLPALPAQVSVVLAGRKAPDSRWSAHPLWASAMQTIALTMLGSAACARLAQAHGAPPALCEDLAERAHGLPLAAVLLASEARLRGTLPDGLGEGLVQALTRRCLEQAPSAAHREALLACALARRATRDLLSHLFGNPLADPLFDWLASQGYVSPSRDGLQLHDLMREAVLEDSRWRDRERFRELRYSISSYLATRMGPGRDAWDTALDFFFMRRGPGLGTLFDLESLNRMRATTAAAADLAAVIRFALNHLPPEEGAAFRNWAGHSAAEIVAARDADGVISGVMLYVRIGALRPDEIDADPVLASARAAVGTAWEDPPDGSYSVFVRHWITREGLQLSAPSPAQTALGVYMTASFADPALRLFFQFGPVPDFIAVMLAALDFRPLPGCSRILQEVRCNTAVRDWRSEPWLDWLRRMLKGGRPPARWAGAQT